MKTWQITLVVVAVLLTPFTFALVIDHQETSEHDHQVAQCLLQVALDGGTNADAEACEQ